MKPLVSVITPIYNGEKTIGDTIDSVLNQTLKDFELIIVDDVSEDNTASIAKSYQEKDKRIRYFKLKTKGGASAARNYALSKAKGKYIAFLDGDDLWYDTKLEKQIRFMQENNYAFTYTDYEYIDDNNNKLGYFRKAPKKVSYFNMLLGDSIGCLTVIYNKEEVGNINICKLAKRNDYAMWCLALKKVKMAYKYNEILSLYRVSSYNSSLSSGKKYKLLKYHFQMHRNVNGFNFIVSSFFVITNIINYFINKTIRDKKIKGSEI